MTTIRNLLTFDRLAAAIRSLRTHQSVYSPCSAGPYVLMARLTRR